MRPMINFVKNNLDSDLIGCEVGVWQGDNALNIMQNLNIKKCYFIDPFKSYIADNGRFFGKDRMLLNLIFTVVRLEPFNDKIQIIVKSSKKGSYDVPDDLDFVYLDGNKNSKFIKEDIRIWYSKVSKDGVLGGHDYELPTVRDAVDDFVKDDKKLYTEKYEGHIDWWIKK